MKHGVLGDFIDDGDDTILYVEPSPSAEPEREHPFAGWSNAGGESRIWMFYEQTLLTRDHNHNLHPQVYELEVMLLRDDEYVKESIDEGGRRGLIRLRGRFSRFRFGRCKNQVVAVTGQRGPTGIYFPRDYASERVKWIAENTTGAWSMRVIQPEDTKQRFALEFSFSSERDAVLFKTWWCG